MNLSLESLQVLNDLVRINKDRVEGYKRASYDTSVPDLKALFCNMADESRKNITVLTREAIAAQDNPINELTPIGWIYNVWLASQLKFVGDPNDSVLNSCEFVEMAALNAYKASKLSSFSSHLTQLIGHQEQSLETSYNVIRAYRRVYAKDENCPIQNIKNNMEWHYNAKSF